MQSPGIRILSQVCQNTDDQSAEEEDGEGWSDWVLSVLWGFGVLVHVLASAKGGLKSGTDPSATLPERRAWATRWKVVAGGGNAPPSRPLQGRAHLSQLPSLLISSMTDGFCSMRNDY